MDITETQPIPEINITKRKRKHPKKEKEIEQPKKDYAIKISFDNLIVEL
jgi:hypothetical protein